ncbi:phage tail assembly chaperone [Vibrio cholerae]|uniref:Uncharacterized protein n=2 Tax=Vibrio cholerae TaxID=666 RepID=A0A655S470_VIBCL|nr:hypothetical protein [Vibrio cholerae]ABQ19447.1 hypothetical protein VC0395_0787 [Vibrio cholerae O395]ACP11311.1 hypothetical protein VC395_A0475 [Vibrio cholerae O395]EEY42067.1 hypothetical protein VIJ_001302 [Vibrio cholerae RC27]EGR0476274.1 hypothetical protein [Vibrio cholerae]EGR2413211.1 hypothetical protein [Vibrio cholerae]
MKYSDTIINKTFTTDKGDKIVKAVTLHAIKQGMLQFKLARVLAPAMGGVVDGMASKDRTLMYSTVFNLIAAKATEELFEELQTLLLGSILDSSGEPLETVERINTYFANTSIHQFDLLVWLFEKQLLEPLLKSSALSGFMPKLKTIADNFMQENKEVE